MYDLIGPLDERFTAYDFEDDDYCVHARAAGLKLAVYDGCSVEHAGSSTFRTSTDWHALFLANRERFQAKWGREP